MWEDSSAPKVFMATVERTSPTTTNTLKVRFNISTGGDREVKALYDTVEIFSKPPTQLMLQIIGFKEEHFFP